MTFGLSGAAIGGLALGAGGIASSIIGGDAAQKAAGIQSQADQAAINAQQQEFQQIQKLLSPFVSSGTNSLTAQGNLIGANGNQAQNDAINQLINSSQYNALNKQGQDAILQNASATGGLRGGNVNAALAQFSPALLNQLIQQQYGNLSGLTTLGANAAAGVGTFGQNTTNQISALTQAQGSAQAGGAIGSAQAFNNGLNSIAQGLGVYKGLGGKF